MEIGAQKGKALLALAILAGLSYTFADQLGLAFAWATAWKGLGVGLLTLWCGLNARARDGWLITAVMAFGALGDVLLELSGLLVGAVAFALGHIIAIRLYNKNLRVAASPSQMMLGLLLTVISPIITWFLTHSVEASSYAMILGMMAGSAWVSRFPRYRTGIGAVMFLVSDWLIFARAGPLAGMAWVSPAIWLLYFGGQTLIAIGVVKTFSADSPA